ncbi:MAG: metalloregulator ArsR/SmtB family transcription factor [Bacteroidota bacterium]
MSKHSSTHPAGNEHLRISSNIMRALAHPLRMKILQFIDSKGTSCVNDIFAAMEIEQSIASQHLRILRLADLVHTRREQKFVFYSINYPKVEEAKKSAAIMALFVDPNAD